jgi:TatD DNase family protein
MKFFPKSTDFIDIHSHRYVQEDGVFRISNVFTSDFPKIPADLPLSIGLHPWYLNEQSIHELPDVLNQVLKLPNILAVGEAGLDRVIKKPVEEQLPVFRRQIEFSTSYQKPLIIHCVKAFPELLKLRKEYKEPAAWIVHGFNASKDVAAECVEAGIYISLSQRLFRNPEKARKITGVVPLSMIFAETDDETMSIQEVYDLISQFYGVSLTEVKRNIYENFRRIY